MRILWVSGRKLGTDLAQSTEENLATHLGKLGHKILLMSPGIIRSEFFSHVGINRIQIPGLETISGGRSAMKKILNLGNKFDLILVDWRYVWPLKKYLTETDTPWKIIDRGPPVKSGIFGYLQRRFWLKAWGLAGKMSSGGVVVSEKHSEYVGREAEVNLEMIVVPAGSIPNRFLVEKSDPNDCLRIVYSGTLEVRRGIKEIFKLHQLLKNHEIHHEIHFCGSGDMEKEVANFCDKNPDLTCHGRLETEEVFRLMSECHLGLMPMPKEEIWEISSPLKLAEYLSSGLSIIGRRHSGNMLSGEEEWCLLSDSDEWEREIASEISSLIPKIRDISIQALSSFELLSWERIASEFATKIETSLNH